MTQALAGHWIAGWDHGGVSRDSINPATGAVLGQWADADPQTAARAIDTAAHAFETTTWREDKALRARVLNAMADRFEAAMDDIVASLSAENGKLLGEAAFECSTVAPKLRYWAGMALTLQGRAGVPQAGRLSLVIREPIGVAGIIVPWNAPVALAIRSLAPALAMGCTAVMKMPGQTALTNALLAEVIGGTPGLPQGVFNQFTESGSAGAAAIVAAPQVPAISFTGSTRTGRVIAAAAAPRLKRLGLELGGKTPMIIFEDANLDMAAFVTMKAITTFAGQFCMAGSRLLVQESACEAMKARIAPLLENIRPGPGDRQESDMGPLIDAASAARVDRLVEEAIAGGAKVLVRGGRVDADSAFYRPVLLELDREDLSIGQDEIFGPVLVLQSFTDEADAIRLANQGDYGLAASVWSNDAARPMRVAQKLQAGTVWLNNWAMVYDDFEEGGFRQSGLGRLNGLAAADLFLEYKHIAMDVGSAAS
ncbi:MAG: aldehyde dehydrogenase family protein [Sphingobium sp.]